MRSVHALLKWLFNFQQPEGQIARWLQKLQEYDLEIVHLAGRSHVNAEPCLEEHITNQRANSVRGREEKSMLKNRTSRGGTCKA